MTTERDLPMLVRGDLFTFTLDYSRDYMPKRQRVAVLEEDAVVDKLRGSGYRLRGVDASHFRRATQEDIRLALVELRQRLEEHAKTRKSLLDRKRELLGWAERLSTASERETNP